MGNSTGLVTEGSGAKIYLADCVISGNQDAWDTTSGGAIIGTWPGTSFIAPGQIEIGSLGPAVGLK